MDTAAVARLLLPRLLPPTWSAGQLLPYPQPGSHPIDGLWLQHLWRWLASQVWGSVGGWVYINVWVAGWLGGALGLCVCLVCLSVPSFPAPPPLPVRLPTCPQPILTGLPPLFPHRRCYCHR